MKSVLLIGATSDVAKAIAEKYASEGWNLLLMGRDVSAIERLAKNYEIRYEIKAEAIELDLTKFIGHSNIIDTIDEFPSLSIVFAGYLGDQQKGQTDWEESQKILDTNFTGVVSVCNLIANKYESKNEGSIVVLSSVAGERGRQSNYLYGAAKAALTAYLSGMRNRLFKNNVHVLTVIPGFMATKMTEGLNLPKLLTALPDEVATVIFKAVKKKKDVVYVRYMWKYIMLVIRIIPEFIFKKLSL